jgi:hypothetical protein
MSFTSRLISPAEETPGTHWIKDWSDFRAGFKVVQKISFNNLTDQNGELG